MFCKILLFEFRYYLRHPIFYVSFIAATLLVFLLITALADRANEARAMIKFNAPIMAARLLLMCNIFSLLVPMILFGRAALRDAETGMEMLVRATPVSFPGLLVTRFAAAFLVSTLIYAGVVWSTELALRMPWVTAEIVGPFRPEAYAQIFALLLLPNIFVFGSAVYAAVSWTRSIIPAYVLLIIFITLVVSARALTFYWNGAVLAEPFGLTALNQITRYWPAAKQNTNLIPPEGLLLWNRLLWSGIGALVLAGTVIFLPRTVEFSRRRAPERLLPESTVPRKPVPALHPGAVTLTDQFILCFRYEAAVALRSWAFLVMLVVLAAACIVVLQFPDPQASIPFLPVSAAIAPRVAESAAVGALLAVILLAGETMWRERRWHISEILDATPASSFIFLAAKLSTLVLVIVIYLFVATTVGVAFQLWSGSADVRLDLYLVYAAIQVAIPFIMYAVLVMTIHTLAPNKYAGHLGVLCFTAVLVLAQYFNIEDGLIVFTTLPNLPMSVMNGFGHYLGASLWFAAYWGGITLLLAIAMLQLWRRGQHVRLRDRLRLIPATLTRGAVVISVFAVVSSAATGIYIYWNTHILNPYYTLRDVERYQAEYERIFGSEVEKLQPRIAEIDMAVDLDPDHRLLHSRGQYQLVNRSAAPIETVRVQFNDEFKVEQVALTQSTLISQQPRFNDYVFQPDKSLAPGESLTLSFAGMWSSAGFRQQETFSPINANGSFANGFLFAPWIGVLPRLFIADEVRRRKHGLPSLQHSAANDLAAKNRNFLAPDSDFVRIGVTVSTALDQTAVAPGTLKREWTDGGRHYFRYETDRAVNFLSILSGRYATARAVWRNVDLAVHYHPSQQQNVPRMLEAMQWALDYYSRTFGPFQHPQLRIAEFPYGAHAQAFPATIAYAEALGFMLEDAGRAVDYVSFVTAHEVAHQWWGHQAVPADMPGAQFLSETLAEYSALMVMETRYGPDAIRHYLKADLDHYLSRRGEDGGEQPLTTVRRDQAHIAYKKGALAMYALKDAMGQQAMDRALRRYLETYRNHFSPYPTAADLVAILREEAGPNHQELITDLFETITFWDFKLDRVTAVPSDGGKWRVRMVVRGTKARADQAGAERSVPMHTNVDIGLFAADPSSKHFTSRDVIVLEKRLMTDRFASFEFITDRRPAFAGVNPYLKLTEPVSKDNIIALPR